MKQRASNDSGKLDAKIAYEMLGDSELAMRKTFRSVANVKWQQVVETLSIKEGLGKKLVRSSAKVS